MGLIWHETCFNPVTGHFDASIAFGIYLSMLDFENIIQWRAFMDAVMNRLRQAVS
jgi:hypothetical protein